MLQLLSPPPAVHVAGEGVLRSASQAKPTNTTQGNIHRRLGSAPLTLLAEEAGRMDRLDDEILMVSSRGERRL